jgi:molybdenum cofactor synthesis domain-containing protein
MSSAKSEIVTAAVLVIGDEILSGRTKDKNIGYIADYLTAIGIDLKEVRVVSDDEAAIVDALNALRAKNTYVFTTGGIGPTHDDITADCVAKAFGVALEFHPTAVAILKERLAKTGGELNEARMRMARIPHGAALVAKEGDVGTELGAIAKAHPEAIIGSYPFIDETQGPNTNIVVRSRDADKLAAVKAEVETMLVKIKSQLAAAR